MKIDDLTNLWLKVKKQRNCSLGVNVFQLALIITLIVFYSREISLTTELTDERDSL